MPPNDRVVDDHAQTIDGQNGHRLTVRHEPPDVRTPKALSSPETTSDRVFAIDSQDARPVRRDPQLFTANQDVRDPPISVSGAEGDGLGHAIGIAKETSAIAREVHRTAEALSLIHI